MKHLAFTKNLSVSSRGFAMFFGIIQSQLGTKRVRRKNKTKTKTKTKTKNKNKNKKRIEKAGH
jgi:hypothetical protein